jgi:hypothetical protein
MSLPLRELRLLIVGLAEVRDRSDEAHRDAAAAFEAGRFEEAARVALGGYEDVGNVARRAMDRVRLQPQAAHRSGQTHRRRKR